MYKSLYSICFHFFFFIFFYCSGFFHTLKWIHSLLDSVGEGEGGMFQENSIETVYYLGWNRSPAQVGCMRQVPRPGALGRPRGSGWRGRWEAGSGWGTHMFSFLPGKWWGVECCTIYNACAHSRDHLQMAFGHLLPFPKLAKTDLVAFMFWITPASSIVISLWLSAFLFHFKRPIWLHWPHPDNSG